MRKWQPLDYIVALFSVTISVLLATVIYDIIGKGARFSDDALELTGAVVTSIVAIISMYVGSQIQKHKDDG